MEADTILKVAALIGSALVVLAGITFWAGRIVQQLEAINTTLRTLGERTATVEQTVHRLELRIARVETLQEAA